MERRYLGDKCTVFVERGGGGVQNSGHLSGNPSSLRGTQDPYQGLTQLGTYNRNIRESQRVEGLWSKLSPKE